MHFIQFGVMGNIGRFSAADGRRFASGSDVVCRTARGLETGKVLSVVDGADERRLDGQVLRMLTDEDRMLVRRLEKDRDRAFEACRQLLRQRGNDALLVDVEALFDGNTLFFHFLDEPAGLDELLEELADTYDSKAKFRHLAKVLVEGCGPGCGTEASGGCGTSSGCGSCAVSGGCGSKSRRQVAST